ncbi:MAG: hypothetical protein FWD63_07185 [Propionibacteriaceae bacterium]|nr:hypothetical protein [Propionibacteriaceae bacterium]
MSLTPPETGNPAIDAALARVVESADASLPEQAQRLSEAQSVLQDVLRDSRDAAQTSHHDG